MNAEPPCHIQVLPEVISSRIAAGEVVERPAAVVKELLDNSLDAQSTLITVEIEEAGRRLIRVTDNGTGMPPEDAELACQRFATSKLTSDSDLLHIQTLGFRGEALPSIASVSKFCLLTQQQGTVTGRALASEGGISWSCEEKPIPPGTQIEVRDLFFNTPGRLKFLKSNGTEFSKICLAVQQAAVAWPTVHFRLMHNGHAVFDFPEVQSRMDRLLQVYGSRLMDRMLPIQHEDAGIRIEGATVNPYHTRSSRTPQEIFVNRRAIKNTTIVHAAYESYGSFLPKGKHPIFMIFVDISPSSVDVNVHPAKREVRFAHPEIIHALVKTAIRQPLKKQTLSQIGLQPAAMDFKEPISESSSSTVQLQDNFASDKPSPISLFTAKPTTTSTVEAGTAAHETPSLYAPTATEWNVVSLGQVNSTFLIAQVNGELQIVDQHTAHERVLFERLWIAWQKQAIQTQALLIPETVDLPPDQCERLTEHLPALSKLGVDIEPFGTRSFVIRSVPSLLGPMPYSGFVQRILEDLAEWNSQDTLDTAVRPILASIACQSAVQAGRPMSTPEITQLITDWAKEGYPMTCPHGRRIALRFSPHELDKIFGRA